MKPFALILTALLATASLEAAAFEKSASFKETTVVYSSEQPLTVGSNVIDLALTRNGAPLGDAKVTLKVFMPEMPGMPYMEYVAEAQPVSAGLYRAAVNLAMAGTWQVHIFVNTPDGKKQRIKSSLNL